MRRKLKITITRSHRTLKNRTNSSENASQPADSSSQATGQSSPDPEELKAAVLSLIALDEKEKGNT